MRAVMTVTGKDSKGIIAKVSAECAANGVNIIDITQSVLGDLFAMIMLTDIDKLSIPFSDFVDRMTALGHENSLEIPPISSAKRERMKGKFIYVSAPSGNCGAECLASVISVAEAVNGRRNAATSADKAGRRTHIELHNRCVTEQTAEFYILADTFSDNGNDANRGGLSVDNTDSYLIGDYTADNVGGSIARNCYHIETYRADGGHGLELLDRERAFANGVYHAAVLGYRNECAGKTADMRGCHGTALLDCVVEHRESRGRTVTACAFKTHFLKNLGDRITDSRSGSE